MVHLDHALTESAKKLKSTFLRIFEKYGRDFEDEADEIDLDTLTIVKNNGHLNHSRCTTTASSSLTSATKQHLNFPYRGPGRPPKSKPFTFSETIKTKLFVVPKISPNDLELDDDFDASMLLILHSDLLSSINWSILEQVDGFECKEHEDEIDPTCFDCVLYSLV